MRHLFLFIVLWTCASILEARADSLNGVVLTELELAETIDQLKDPQTDMNAVEKLVKFSGEFLHPSSLAIITSNRQLDDRCKRAAHAVRNQTSLSTKLRALEHKDDDVRFWAVTVSFRMVRWDEHAETFKKLASLDPDTRVRGRIIDSIRYRKDCAEFIAEETARQTNPWVLMKLMKFDDQKSNTKKQWYERAVLHLQSKDAALREEWLNYIWGNVTNSATAPMYRIAGEQELVKQLRSISVCGTDEEKHAALKALEGLERRGG